MLWHGQLHSTEDKVTCQSPSFIFTHDIWKTPGCQELEGYAIQCPHCGKSDGLLHKEKSAGLLDSDWENKSDLGPQKIKQSIY